MSEEEKLEPEKLKEKLKDMGVMQDGTAEPASNKSSPVQGKWPVIAVVVIAVLGVWWWIASDGDEGAEQDTASYSLPGDVPPVGYPPPFGFMPPPPPGHPSMTGEADTSTGPAGMP